YYGGLRITDEDNLPAVLSAVGSLRVRIEALLSMGLANSPMHGARLRVASGNFVTARPLGVRDGVDFAHTGEVRRVDAEGIRQRLDDGNIVLLSCLGYSPTGEVFNLSAEDVATAAAVALKADKLISLVEGPGLVDGQQQLIEQLTPTAAETVLSSRRALPDDVRRQLIAAVHACRNGIGRAHLLSRHVDGALLQELFTRDGVGTMITSDRF
ncbi:MAG: amino-acid N-acetyltransferase, partial [Gammaproteobacteria bacterium]|nr:amino-acid N-acetyltransferase [Gammaproteobacteria bacterium]